MKTIYVREFFEKKDSSKTVRKIIGTAVAFALLAGMYGLGRMAGAEYRLQKTQQTNADVLTNVGVSTNTDALTSETENWGLGFDKPGTRPKGNATVEEMKAYNAYYMAESEDNILYLTFDCGYENGNTESILDALKKHDAPATFFVVGHFLETAPELVIRMAEEGHTVGNHTYHHPDMSRMATKEEFAKELDAVREKYESLTGKEMSYYYRPPQGKYSKQNLQMAKDMGYATFFWSVAYVDWNVKEQPSHAEAMKKLTDRVHPGAIVLLHNTSKTNGEILDDILSKWEDMGYKFGKLEDFHE